VTPSTYLLSEGVFFNFYQRVSKPLLLTLRFRAKTSVPVATLSVQDKFAEIEELSLRTPRPVATTE